MKTETVTLPSGLEVTFRRPGVLGLIEIYGSMPNVAALEDVDPEAPPQRLDVEQLKTAVRMVCVCCVKPNFTDIIDPKRLAETVKAGGTSVDDIEPDDFMFLAAKLTDFINLKGKKDKLDPSSETVKTS
jgi:hypothetical protein